jgi:hypothetical protein
MGTVAECGGMTMPFQFFNWPRPAVSYPRVPPQHQKAGRTATISVSSLNAIELAPSLFREFGE